jgi:hypothetical protein
MVGITTIVLMLVVFGAGLGYLFGALTANLQLTAVLGQALIAGEFDAGAAKAAVQDIEAGNWITFATLLLALAASSVGEWFGERPYELLDSIQTGEPVEA